MGSPFQSGYGLQGWKLVDLCGPCLLVPAVWHASASPHDLADLEADAELDEVEREAHGILTRAQSMIRQPACRRPPSCGQGGRSMAGATRYGCSLERVKA